MGDELRGESLVHLNVRFSTETELKAIQDMLYEKSGQGVSFTGLVEAMAHEVTIVTAIHNIKSNKGSKTAGVDKMKMDKYLQMPKDELILLIQSCFRKYQPKPARREYIPKSNGKMRPLGIPTVLDRIIQECVRLIIEPICEARFYPHSYGFRPYRAQKHAIRDIINVINAGCKSPYQAVWAVEGDIQGCFDNISHRILLQKVWRMGIHDKRVLKIISQMLKAGYIERDLYHKTETGTPQGGILSPLLSNIYLNDFDWYVGRTYMEPHRKCKHKCNDNLLEYAVLEEKAAAATAHNNELSARIKAAEKRMAEIAVLRTHIINYAKTRDTYVAYRKAGYSKKFREEHEEGILLHQAAKNAFDDMGVKKLPKVKELQAEYARLLEEKKKTYTEYRRSREEMRELLAAKANVDRLLNMEMAYDMEKEKGHDQR